VNDQGESDAITGRKVGKEVDLGESHVQLPDNNNHNTGMNILITSDNVYITFEEITHKVVFTILTFLGNSVCYPVPRFWSTIGHFGVGCERVVTNPG